MSRTTDARDEGAQATELPPLPPRVLKSILRSRHSASFASTPALLSSTPTPSEPQLPPPPPPPLSTSEYSSLPPMPPRQPRIPLLPSHPLPSASRKGSTSRPSSSSSPTPSIQPLKLSPSELESQLAHLADVLCDTTTHDWTKRIAALQQLTAIALGCIPSLTAFLCHFRPLRSGLCSQILDLRSSVVRETCSCLSTLAQSAGDGFSDEADVFLPHLIRLVSVSVQVIASSGDDAIRTLLRFTRPRHALQKIIDSCASSSAITRLRCMEYVLHWMVEWREDVEYLGRWETALKKLIVDKLSDKTEGVRATARKAVVVLADIWPERGRQLVDGLEGKVRRLVEDERRQGGKKIEVEGSAAEPQKPRSVSRKSVKGGRKAAPLVEDKENSHPNTDPLPAAPPSAKPTAALAISSVTTVAAAAAARPPLALQPEAALAPVKSARRASFTIQSVTAIDGDASFVSSSSGRLGGAQRIILGAAAARATGAASAAGLPPHPPPRPRRLSIVPFPASMPAAASPSASPSSAISPSSSSTTASPHPSVTPSSPPPPSAAIPAIPPAALPKTAYEALLSTTLSSDLQVAIDAAFADFHRKPRPSTSGRRQSHTVHQPAPIPAPQQHSEENPAPVGRPTALSNKRNSLGSLPSTSSSTKPPPRRSSMSTAPLPPAESATPRPSTVASALLLVKDAGWSTRTSALQSLASTVVGWEGGGEVGGQFDRIMYALVERLTDPHHRVVGAALSALVALLTSLSSHPISPSLLPHLSALFPPLLLTLSHQRLGLRQQANDSLNLLSVTVAHAALIGPLSLALMAKEGRVRRGAEEFLGYVVSVGDEREQRRKREVVEALVGEAGKRARAVLQGMLSTDDTAMADTVEPAETDAERSPVDDAGQVESPPLLGPNVAEAETKWEMQVERAEEAVEAPEVVEAVSIASVEESGQPTSPLPFSLLLSPYHPINQPPPLPALLPPPALSSPPPLPTPAPVPSSLSPIAASALARFVQEEPQRRGAEVPPPTAAPLLSPASAPQPIREGRSRTPPAPITKTQSAAKPGHRPHSASTSSSSSSSSSFSRATTDRTVLSKPSQSSKRSMVMLSPPSSSQSSPPRAVSSPGVSHGGSSKVSRFDAYDGRLSDADVSALIYQWRHAEAAVVQQSLQWVESLISQPCALSSSSLHRLVLALLDTTHLHPTLTANTLAVLSLFLSPSSPSPHLRSHLASPSFPHLVDLLTLLLSLLHSTRPSDPCRATLDSLWAAALTLHSPTLLTSLTSLLSSTPPTHRDSLTLLLTALTTLLPRLTPASLNPCLPSLAASLSVLLGHEWVMVRKHAVKVWVAMWEVLGEGVERWLEGLGGVSRKLVEIYLNKAREEREAKQGQGAQRE